jgi:arabinofuranosyltransferase
VPLVLAVFAARAWWRRRPAPSELLRRTLQPPCLATLAVLAHLAYYTLVVGGDHFEFRVYSHVVPLLYVGCLWMLAAVSLSRLHSALVLTGFLVLGSILPWTHWKFSQELSTRYHTRHMHVAVSEHLPAGFRWYARAYDDLQSWLIDRSICMRHQEHKVFYESLRDELISREEGLKIGGEGFPIFASFAVGVRSWVLPHVNIIDHHGLNDYVIARSRVRRADRRPPRQVRGRPLPDRQMAHERFPPRGYEKALDPNVWLPKDGGIVIFPRLEPLTADRIREVERHWRKVIAERAPSRSRRRQKSFLEATPRAP